MNPATTSQEIANKVQTLQLNKPRTPAETDALIIELQRIIDRTKAAIELQEAEMRIARERGKFRDAFVEVAVGTQGETIEEE